MYIRACVRGCVRFPVFTLLAIAITSALIIRISTMVIISVKIITFSLCFIPENLDLTCSQYWGNNYNYLQNVPMFKTFAMIIGACFNNVRPHYYRLSRNSAKLTLIAR